MKLRLHKKEKAKPPKRICKPKTLAQKRLEAAKREIGYDTNIKIICAACKIPYPVKEHKFAKESHGREFAFDFAWVDKRIALEIDGRVHRIHDNKWLADMEKFNLAVMLGWRILHFTPDMLNTKKPTIHKVTEIILKVFSE